MAWKLFKTIFMMLAGGILLAGIQDLTVGQESLVGSGLRFVAVFIWVRYVIGFYYPREEKI